MEVASWGDDALGQLGDGFLPSPVVKPQVVKITGP
jgi:hypothetical protein